VFVIELLVVSSSTVHRGLPHGVRGPDPRSASRRVLQPHARGRPKAGGGARTSSCAGQAPRARHV